MKEQDQSSIHERVIAELTRKATDEGRIVELGFLSMLLHVIPRDASQTQIQEMRKAFFLGAQHVFASIMGVLDEGVEATENDMRRMTNIATELEAFKMDVTTKHHPPPWRKQ